MSPPQPITISPERITQIEKTVHTYLDGFHKPLDVSFTDIYHPDIQWFGIASHSLSYKRAC